MGETAYDDNKGKAVGPLSGAPAAVPRVSEGHRSRLMSRYEESGIGSLADYEIVELILAHIIPRKDTKAIAKDLLKRYGSIGALLNAEKTELSKVNGVGRRAGLLFQLFRDVAVYCLREKYEKRPIVLHRKDVEEYLRLNLGFKGEEYIAVLFLDNGNNIIGTEVVCEGTVNQCAVYPREIIEHALRRKAASIIVAHNHPGGGANPSEADWLITERLAAICGLLEIPLLDHVIVLREKTVSLKEFARWPGHKG
jgi:DNA repair protein RadC